MVTISNYFAFIIFVMGTILVAQDISVDDEKKFIQDILEAHNHFRSIHDSKDLELDDDMYKLAIIRAHELKTKYFSALPSNNLVNYSVTDFDGTLDSLKIVSKWYENEQFYNYNDESNIDPRATTFVKVVWKNTEKIGVGVLVSDNKCYVAVIYLSDEPLRGQYSSNIIRPKKTAEQNQQETNRFYLGRIKRSIKKNFFRN